MAINADEILDIMQHTPDSKGALLVILKNDNTFGYTEYGELTFFEKLGMLDAFRHDILQQPYTEVDK